MFNELTEKRRSVRVYAKRPVEAEKIDAIIEAALRSPSGRAARPWSFVVVTDKTLLEKLSVARPQGAAYFNEGTTSTQYIAKLLGLPENLAVQCIIAIGYPGEEMVPYKKDELLFNKVSYNRYGQKKA
jgi:nitroreductase